MCSTEEAKEEDALAVMVATSSICIDLADAEAVNISAENDADSCPTEDEGTE